VTQENIFRIEFLPQTLTHISLQANIADLLYVKPKRIEYILEWNLDNPSVCIFSVPFSLKGISKCTNHVNVHKLFAVEYINTVCFLDYSFQFRFF